MTVSVTTSVVYPAPGVPMLVSFATTESGANYVRIACTSAPTGSEEAKRLLDSASSEIVLHAGDSASIWSFVPGAAGIYTFTAYEIQRGATAYGGGYQDSADGYQTETVLASNVLQIYVGDWVTTQLGVAPNTATLRLLVVNNTIRQTTLATHQQASPAIVDAKTPLADSAGTSAAMTAALAGLIDVAAPTALGDPGSVLADILEQYHAHHVSGTYHYAPDAYNAVSHAYDSPSSPDSIAKAATALAQNITRHMLNDDSTGVGATSWHQTGGVTAGDLSTALAVNSANSADRRSQIALIADLWRVYEAHRVTAVHQASDTVNACAALPAIVNIHRLFLAAIAASSPETPVGANPGVTTLVFSGGFTSG